MKTIKQGQVPNPALTENKPAIFIRRQRGLALVTRVALFAALVYVFSWGTSFLPNVNLIFFVVFTAGCVWGAAAGALTGAVGMALWTLFNPFGPAPIPIALAQIVGASLSGPVGSMFSPNRNSASFSISKWKLVLGALLCTVGFYLPVSVMDAYMWQPFWPRLLAGMLFVTISLVSNMILFPLLGPVISRVYRREAGL